MKDATNRLASGIAILACVAWAVPDFEARADDFATRCADRNVVRCVGFDAPTDLAGSYGDPSGTMPGDARPAIDTTTKASGGGSMKLTIPSHSGANSSGSYFTNFTSDYSVQFGENSEFFVQWRQRFSAEFLATHYDEGGGWKQVIIGTGDKSRKQLYASCTALETVVQNTYQRGFPQMYNSCTGSSSHGPYVPFEEPTGGSDFKLQNGRPSPGCLYSKSGAGWFPPVGTCIGYFPDEWMTFQVSIKTGPRVNDEWTKSYVKLWIAREGQPSQLAIDWGPWNLTAGAPGEDQKFGKIWLLDYHTGKSSAQDHPVGYTWYDELIVSRAKIADPADTGGARAASPSEQ